MRDCKANIFFAVILFISFITSQAHAQTRGPISEETPPAICFPGNFVNLFRCTGSYCDNISFSCASVNGANIVGAGWSPFFSEEQGNNRTNSMACGDDVGGLIAGFSCNGSYCDNLSIYCVYVQNIFKTDCRDTQQISEEEGGILSFGIDRFADTVRCFGSYCDNKSFRTCRVTLAVP